jgi:Fe-S-cluster formation regulator IscX/YfhJ
MTKEEMDAIRGLASCLNDFKLEVVQRLAILETNNTDTRKAVDAIGTKMDNFHSRLSVGSERFVSIFNRIGDLEEFKDDHEKDSKAKLWQVITILAPYLISAAAIIIAFRGG